MHRVDIDKLKEILLTVEKPSRYSGGEFNAIEKKDFDTNMCFCFPDIYEIGMSNLGLQILYDIVNKEDGFMAERCYAPWVDFGEKLKENDIPLFSLETKTPLLDFDVVGFSLQFELLYSNVLYMFDLADIPFYSKDRDESYPLIIAGGPCAVNPEPIKDFFDLIVVGEGEEVDLNILKLKRHAKKEGWSKLELLKECKKLKGVYCPMLYEEGEIVKKAVVEDFENAPYPTKLFVPNINIVHDRAVMELYRGCASGCRFCQAGFYYRPIRERSSKRIVDLATKVIDSTGYEELSLCSLSTGDYSQLRELIDGLSRMTKEKHVELSLPSLRLSSFSGDIVQGSRKNSLTFAPEAGTQRLRNVINKNISDEDIDNIKDAFLMGYRSVKLYFMLGLPTETNEDLDGIAEICNRLKIIYYQTMHKKNLNITVSCAVFIPKPCTPFQWVRQITIDEMIEKQKYLKEKLREIKGVRFSYHGAESSKLEAAFARGDDKFSKVIECAYKKGCKFDSWSEYFYYDKWLEAFDECGVDIESYSKAIPLDSPLPWDYIDTGVKKEYFKKEYRNAFNGESTRSCRDGCNGCGVLSLGRCSII